MFGVLIEILRFDGVAVHERGARQGEIALVLPFGIGGGTAAPGLELRRARPQMRQGTAIVRAPARGSLKFLCHFQPI
jgi:hypothetical protein